MKQLEVPRAKRKWPGHMRSNRPMQIPYSAQAQTDFGESKKSHHEIDLIESLRNGDEEAFSILIDRYNSSLLRLAMAFVPNRAVAEEVVQETWMGVLEGIRRFEGRSSLKTWIFRILTNRAKTRGTREKRYVGFADIGSQGIEEEAPSDNPEDRYTSGTQDSQLGINPRDRDHMTPEKYLFSKECLDEIAKAIQTLPPIQQQVIILSDVEESLHTDICKMLNITENNRRVILHRARCKVRQILREYLEENINEPVPKNSEAIGSRGSLNAHTVLSQLSRQMVGPEQTAELNFT